MAFYTADWVRKLIKQDADNVLEVISKPRNDLRSYIDSVLPFTLYLDLATIEKNVLYPGAPAVIALKNYLEISEESTRVLLLAGYKQVIKDYNSGKFPIVSSEELQGRLNELQTITKSSSSIRTDLKKLFNKTVVLSPPKTNTYCIALFPSFRTISDRFGKDFREAVKNTPHYSKLPEIDADGLYVNSVKAKFDDFLEGKTNTNKELLAGTSFGKLQNLGHIEVDLISSTSNEVKRGLVSPRLIQALLELPKDVRADRLAVKFSKETLQANTRVIVRKKFSSTKLVLEMLVESGIMIGSPESQETNLLKATKEKQFAIGKNLTAKILADKNILLNLETSKSIKGYLAEDLTNIIKTGKSKSYSSNAEIKSSTKTTTNKVTLAPKKLSESSKALPSFKSVTRSYKSSLAELQLLLDSALKKAIEDNMQGENEYDLGSRRLLTNRTGRFAGSVKVDRLTQSRAGMVTAFYSYMRNPYATFSLGGRQQSPRSRDPKLLISKSIREVAQKLAYDNLRAVNV